MYNVDYISKDLRASLVTFLCTHDLWTTMFVAVHSPEGLKEEESVLALFEKF